jgi:hypothetical protein
VEIESDRTARKREKTAEQLCPFNPTQAKDACVGHLPAKKWHKYI